MRSVPWISGGKKILIVDDNATNRLVFREQLRGCGCIVEEAEDAISALQVLREAASREEPFDVGLLDFQMPVMDGYEASGKIRERETPGKRRIPIVAMTAHAMKGDRERSLEAGMDDHVNKPVSGSALQEVLEKYLTSGAPALQQAPPVEGAPSGPVDIQRIREIADGDTAFEQELIELFLQDMTPRLDSLQAVIREGNSRGLREMDHSVKGASASTGARGMQRIAARLEEMGERGELGDTDRLMDELRSEFEAVRAFFVQYLKGLSRKMPG